MYGTSNIYVIMCVGFTGLFPGVVVADYVTSCTCKPSLIALRFVYAAPYSLGAGSKVEAPI